MKASLYLQKLRELTYNQILDNDGIASKSADNIFMYFQSEQFLDLINEFSSLEQDNKGPIINLNSSLSDQNKGVVCITGTFTIPRPDIAKKLEFYGYKISNSVSSNTDYLVCGDKAGSKLSKAEKLGIRIVYDYNELLL